MNFITPESSPALVNAEDTPEVKGVDANTGENVKRRTVVGPWKNVAEFCKVYDWLFGGEYSAVTRQQALAQIRIWNLRRSTQCPAAVLATSVIIEVQQKDHPESIFSAEVLQTLYANAFTRFFNFMSSIMQTHNMRTMYQTANELGLESFVVDLRHICAHGQVLPPLQVLRNMAEYCIVWLHNYYWYAQRNTMCDVDATRIRRKDKTAFDENVSSLFEIYDAALEGHMKGATNIKTLKRHLHGKRFHNLKEYYAKNEFENLRETFDHVVKQLCSLVKRDMAIKDISEIYIGALLRMRYFFAVSDSVDTDKKLESLIAVTQTLFRMLAVYGFLEDFFVSLIEIAENPIADAAKRKGASFWAVEIAKGFKAFRKCKQMFKAEMDEKSTINEPPFSFSTLSEISKGTLELLTYSGVDMKRTLLFGDHYRRPWIWVFERSFLEDRIEAMNEYTAPILKNILPLVVPTLNASEMETFSKLIECFFDIADTELEKKEKAKKENTQENIFTAEDLLRKLNKTDECDMEVEPPSEAFLTNKLQTYGLWSEVEENDWKSCPLGRLPWEL